MPSIDHRRLHSLSGVIPLGAFFVVHTLVAAQILRGDRAFADAVQALERTPALSFVEMLFIVTPLAYHGAYGVWRARAERGERGSFPTVGLANAQRAAGVVTLAFVTLHVWMTSAQKWFFGAAPTSLQTMLEASLSSTTWGVPWIAIAYLLGVLATSFHFSAGVWSFARAWKLATSERASRRVAWAAGAVGSALFLTAALVVVQLATGTRFLEGPEPLPDGPARPACAAP